jgi:hypothetical protein
MPVILAPDAYDRWLANIEPDPRDLLAPFPSELMKIWPIGTRMNKPENDDGGILDPAKAQDADRVFSHHARRTSPINTSSTTAPIVAAMICANTSPLGKKPRRGNSHDAMNAPTIPTTMFPTTPKP